MGQVVVPVALSVHWSKLCIDECSSYHLIVFYCRTYFKTRNRFQETDHINIDKFTVVQLRNCVQDENTSCGIYCLKAWPKFWKCMPYAYMFKYIDGWAADAVTKDWWISTDCFRYSKGSHGYWSHTTLLFKYVHYPTYIFLWLSEAY